MTLVPMSSNSSATGGVMASARAILAGNVIKLRGKQGWSQEALAFKAGLHRTFIAHVERQARNISIDNVERLAIAFGVPAYVLLLDSPDSLQDDSS